MKRNLFIPTRCVWALLCAVALLATGCGRMPAERTIYRKARQAAKADSQLPPGAKFKGIGDAAFYIGKSGGRVDLLYTFKDPEGEKQTRTYTAVMKRVARTWVVAESGPMPGEGR